MLTKPVVSVTKKTMSAARKSWRVTLGAANLTTRSTTELVNRFAARGEYVDLSNRAALKRLLRRGQAEVREVEEAIETRVETMAENLVDDLGVVTKDEVRSVERKVDRLNHRLDTAIEDAEAEAQRREAAAKREEKRRQAEAQREKERRAEERRQAQAKREEERRQAEAQQEKERRAEERRQAEAERQRELETAPFRGYDEMRVPELVERIPALNEEDLLRMRRYEEAHAAHKGVLEAIDEELAKRQPLPNYNETNATEIARQVAELDVDQALAIREYEANHGNRVSVLRATERRLGELIGVTDYVGLTVRDAVERLPELNDEDLLKVRRFEEAHENRQGILRAIDRLLADRMPLPGYGDLTVDEINAQLEGMNAEQLQQVREYETAHSNRVTILRAVEKRQADLAQGQQEQGQQEQGQQG